MDDLPLSSKHPATFPMRFPRKNFLSYKGSLEDGLEELIVDKIVPLVEKEKGEKNIIVLFDDFVGLLNRNQNLTMLEITETLNSLLQLEANLCLKVNRDCFLSEEELQLYRSFKT